MIITSLLTLTSCNNSNVNPYSETSFAMGTVCSITLYEKVDDFNFDEAFKIVEEIENRMSPVITNSELDQINSSR